MKRCVDCKYWTSGDYPTADFGSCGLIKDCNDVVSKVDVVSKDDFDNARVYSWDYESYASGAYVGCNFSCRYWDKKVG